MSLLLVESVSKMLGPKNLIQECFHPFYSVLLGNWVVGGWLSTPIGIILKIPLPPVQFWVLAPYKGNKEKGLADTSVSPCLMDSFFKPFPVFFS